MINGTIRGGQGPVDVAPQRLAGVARAAGGSWPRLLDPTTPPLPSLGPIPSSPPVDSPIVA